MQSVKSSWAMEYGEGKSDLHQDSIFTKSYQCWDPEVKFFEKYDSMVECLVKWEGHDKLNDHEVWRKVPGAQGFPNWLDVERGACNPKETMHRKKKKKRKNEGRNPFRGQKTAPSRDGENLSRRTIRVVSSKERNKDMFPQNLSLPKVMLPPLGFSEFRIGNDFKDKSKQQVSKAPTSNRLDSLYKELMAKESRLKEIATNILKTDANSVLLHSILRRRNDPTQLGKGTRNSHNFNNNLNGSRSIREGAGTDNRNKRGNNASISTVNRNIVTNGQSTHGTQDRGNERDTGAQEQGTSNTLASPIQDTTGLNANSQSESILEKGKSSGIPNVRMVETSNRFMLMDEEGNELEKNSGGVDSNITNLYDGKNMNSGWIKKQERTLNKEYINREDKNDPPAINLDMDDSIDNQEEVESETDATAQMMNIDGHPVVATNSSCMNNMVLDGPNQPGVSLTQA
ncbi:hypothetical protein L1987_56733 [Smallanthus sonchifolius]|uniref:Uncharacterized protein n=1 Tax=Smallanthus sonchifolius TaxID=185202 RepID=A0ACB9DAZ9_9ASTR|nr:hypothetical protein L1987_56733 [Smallanthus sonchifolius]